ncbi:MAG: hypothetical protein AYK22_04250 [Thermoplasmatales archaeon SG8-52-3]|nr:MAG: hypothetical protein AYK22_04250 [Thermoplasmatales archaeon SG8-52-3]
MFENIHKKIIAFSIVIIFIFLTISPIIDAKVSNNKISVIVYGNDDNDNSDFDLLIICPKKFSFAMQPLARHKEKYNILTKIVTLKSIYSQHPEGRDDAEKIKLFIKDAYDNSNISYVLLVGGKKTQFNSWNCPVRYVQMSDSGSWESEILSDLYFADLYDSEGKFSSWDSDGDGHYGEWDQGEQPEDKYLDLYPEVAIGRLPCRNRLEVRIMIRKIIKYEKSTYGKSWFWDIVAIAGDTYPEYQNEKWVGNEGEYYADLVLENMSDFNNVTYYTSDGTLKGWYDIYKAINKGCGFLYFNGHASPRTWSTHFPNSKNWTKAFSVNHIRLLHNRNKLPICVVGGCHTNQFDVSIFKVFNGTQRWRGEATPECWSWLLTRKFGGGSIATIGCTALGFTKEDKESFDGGACILEVQFFKQYGQDNVDIIGDAWANAVSWYIDTYPVDWDNPHPNDSWIDVQIVQTWNLFGDPSLKMGGYSN